ncbi:MAG: hypothetical protein N2651_09005 [Fimbriimonadales bacterium]|nr:hypothetical protein [Fimbriimonadales bacterium]
MMSLGHKCGWGSLRYGVASVMVSGLVGLVSAQSIRWFPELNPSGSDSGSLAWDISADGQVVVGSISTSGGFRPFRWTRDGGYEILSNISGGAYSVSADGQVVVGFLGSPNRAFRWTSETGALFLPTLSQLTHSARAVSADGRAAAGVGTVPQGSGSSPRAVIWTPEGVRAIVPNRASQAFGISADGNAVAGFTLGTIALATAFRWTPENGLEEIGTLGGIVSIGWDISADGSTVVGQASNEEGQQRAFRWRADTGIQNLGALGGNSSIAFGVNHDGSAVFGMSYDALQRVRAFMWTESEGIRDLNEVFADVLTDGSVLVTVRAVSLDGRYLVGWGDRPNQRREAFVLDTWRFGAAREGRCVDDEDLLAVLFAFGTSGTGYTRHEDINKDGIVDDADLLIVLSNFGEGCR